MFFTSAQQNRPLVFLISHWNRTLFSCLTSSFLRIFLDSTTLFLSTQLFDAYNITGKDGPSDTKKKLASAFKWAGFLSRFYFSSCLNMSPKTFPKVGPGDLHCSPREWKGGCAFHRIHAEELHINCFSFLRKTQGQGYCFRLFRPALRLDPLSLLSGVYSYHQFLSSL